MRKIQSLWFLSALALFLSVGISLSAQQTPAPATPDAQAQTPSTPDTATPPAAKPETAPTAAPDAQTQPSGTASQTAPGQTPDQANRPAPEGQAATSTPTDSQSFSGTIVKSGDKYVLQDEVSGKTYDLDHQDQVQKFEGKRVKVHGTLDASGKLIHVQ